MSRKSKRSKKRKKQIQRRRLRQRQSKQAPQPKQAPRPKSDQKSEPAPQPEPKDSMVYLILSLVIGLATIDGWLGLMSQIAIAAIEILKRR